AEAARGEGDDPASRFALLVEHLALYHTHRRDLGFLGASEMRSLGPENRHRITGMRNRQQHMVDKEVADGVRCGMFHTSRPEEAARAVATMCTALTTWFNPDGPLRPEEIAAHYVEFALNLVRAYCHTPQSRCHSPAEPDLLAGHELAERIGIGDDPDDRVAAGDRVVGPENDRLAGVVHLDTAAQTRFAGQFVVGQTLQAGAVQPDPDPV